MRWQCIAWCAWDGFSMDSDSAWHPSNATKDGQEKMHRSRVWKMEGVRTWERRHQAAWACLSTGGAPPDMLVGCWGSAGRPWAMSLGHVTRWQGEGEETEAGGWARPSWNVTLVGFLSGPWVWALRAGGAHLYLRIKILVHGANIVPKFNVLISNLRFRTKWTKLVELFI